jgi:hypothetical protein
MTRSLRTLVAILTVTSLFLAGGPALAQASGPLPVQTPTTIGLKARAVPDARNYASMVYDPIHGDLILLAAQNGSFQFVPGVWSFDAGNRTWHYLGDFPGGDFPDLAAFDASAGKVIVHMSWLFTTTGEMVSETWAFDPMTRVWENRNPVMSPPPGLCGCGAQMAYDAESKKDVMFGGIDVAAFYNCVQNGCDDAGWFAVETNDTWVYDYASNRWTKMPRPADESRLPSRRNSHGLTYDSGSDRIILFGGGDVWGPATDTWAYDYNTNTWTNLKPAVSPRGREYGYLAYDQRADKTVLFGGIGYDFNSEWLLQPAETWTYDFNANNWMLNSPSTSPSARGWQAMAYSKKADAVVIFGGGIDRANPTNETWLYRTRADRWSQVT